MSDDCEIQFSIVVQGHSVTHLDPSLNTRANFLHPFKLSSSYHLIKAKRKWSLHWLEVTLATRLQVRHATVSLSLTHSYFPLRRLTAGAYSEIHIHSRKSSSVERISHSFHLNLMENCLHLAVRNNVYWAKMFLLLMQWFKSDSCIISYQSAK